jgi:predicted DsbA family dithiol-disulfide isomerase
MHNQAMLASEAVMAAHAQGKFEPMQKKLHEMNARPDRDKIIEAARAVGLDMERFTKDLDTHAFKADIDAMVKEAVGVGATGTPASFVNGRYLSGAQPYEAFKKLVDEEIAKAKAGAAPAAGEKKEAAAAK